MDEVLSLYTSLLNIGQQAYAAGLFLVAYHALCGALHCAVLRQDLLRVSEVELWARVYYDKLELEYRATSPEKKPGE
ncbi:MAG: hypothetical protein EOP06_27655, partial [Proteobacteria bacterium]